jgi:hypothetical protein
MLPDLPANTRGIESAVLLISHLEPTWKSQRIAIYLNVSTRRVNQAIAKHRREAVQLRGEVRFPMMRQLAQV